MKNRAVNDEKVPLVVLRFNSSRTPKTVRVILGGSREMGPNVAA